MAEDGLFFRGLAQVHSRFGTPARSILLMAGLGMFYVFVRTFAQLADQFIVGIWPFYAAGVVALFVLRARRPDAERPYRTWGYPWVPAAFLLGAMFLLGNYLVSEPWIFAADMAIIASGVLDLVAGASVGRLPGRPSRPLSVHSGLAISPPCLMSRSDWPTTR